VADDVTPPADVALRPLAKVRGWGPSAEVLALAEWATWRWGGRLPHFLRTASPDNAVLGLPAPEQVAAVPVGPADPLTADALAGGAAVVRLPPGSDVFPLLVAAAALGSVLVVAPAHATAALLARRLRRAGVPTALLPKEWARAAAGTGVVVGARSAAWAPAPGLAAVVVLDEHEEVHQEEAAPTWHAREVAVERARRAGVPCVLVSPVPSLEALAAARLVAPDRSTERAGWPFVDVVDLGRQDPLTTDLYSSKVVDLVRSGGRVVCVLNRKGRVPLLACRSCGDLARCEACGAAVGLDEGALLVCRRCRATRPGVCLSCGSSGFKARRLGTARAREDLERLAGVPVGEVVRETDALPDARVLVGTEAVLRRVEAADAVAFLDLDAELLAPRYRAGEEAMALVARAARLLGPRSQGGRLVLQTRLPRHEVVLAALHADPTRLSEVEAARRRELGWPPFCAMATISGPPAEAYVADLRRHLGLQVMGPSDGTWLVRAPDHQSLCDALAATPRPSGRLRVAVDPPRV
jgi:primosomal protein N' (replication factor Y)